MTVPMNQTLAWLKTKAPELVPLVQTGELSPVEAFERAFSRLSK